MIKEGFEVKRKSEFKKKTDGQSLVEFALILPVLLVLIIGIIEFGWIFNGQITITNAAREGVRAAVVQGETDAYIAAKSAVNNFTASSSLDINPADITFELLDSDGNASTEFKTGNTLVVTVPAKISALTKFFNGNVLPADGIVSLTSTVKMRIE